MYWSRSLESSFCGDAVAAVFFGDDFFCALTGAAHTIENKIRKKSDFIGPLKG
jgi:hypothetical protein